MRLDFDTPPRIDVAELIDDENEPYSDFRAAMTDVRNANRFLFGTAPVTRQVKRWLASAGREPVTMLDVATGSADIPEAVHRLAARTGRSVNVIGLDYSAPIVRFAREQVGSEDWIRMVRGDAFRLPFADSSVDFILCSLAFHHFGFDGCVNALREMERVSRRGWIVNDLRRAWSAWLLLRAVMAVVPVNRLSLHDGPASVLRAYSVAEYRAMVEAIGMRIGDDVALRRSAFYRVALIRDKSAA